ncbi:MAG: WYL domain-containing protein [Bacteroidetes bacterium]|nr:WYL domain-containing protein [Bacteroidota bacterium]
MSATEDGAYITLSERRRTLLEKYLQKRVGYTKKQLMKILADELSDVRDAGDFSLRTLNFDLKYLANCGAEIQKEKRKAKNRTGRVITEYYYRYANSKWTFRKQLLDSDAVQSIKVAATILKQIPGLKLHHDLLEFCESVENQSLHSSSDRTYIQFDTRPYYDGNKHLIQILDACKLGSVISFDYQSFKADKAKRVVLHPYLLKEYNNRWFVIGMTEEAHIKETYEISQYGLERIKGKIKNEGLEHYYHPDFNPDEYFAHVIGVSAKPGATVENVVLRFAIDRAHYVETNRLHSTQHAIEGKATKTHKTFSYELIPNQELESLILSFGEDIEVLKPEKLREAITIKINLNKKIYI